MVGSAQSQGNHNVCCVFVLWSHHRTGKTNDHDYRWKLTLRKKGLDTVPRPVSCASAPPLSATCAAYESSCNTSFCIMFFRTEAVAHRTHAVSLRTGATPQPAPGKNANPPSTDMFPEVQHGRPHEPSTSCLSEPRWRNSVLTQTLGGGAACFRFETFTASASLCGRDTRVFSRRDASSFHVFVLSFDFRGFLFFLFLDRQDNTTESAAKATLWCVWSDPVRRAWFVVRELPFVRPCPFERMCTTRLSWSLHEKIRHPHQAKPGRTTSTSKYPSWRVQQQTLNTSVDSQIPVLKMMSKCRTPVIECAGVDGHDGFGHIQ